MTDREGEGAPAVVRNEFAAVSIEVIGEPGRQTLRIVDVSHGRSIELDPLELECLAWSEHRDLRSILDPGRLTEIDP